MNAEVNSDDVRTVIAYLKAHRELWAAEVIETLLASHINFEHYVDSLEEL